MALLGEISPSFVMSVHLCDDRCNAVGCNGPQNKGMTVLRERIRDWEGLREEREMTRRRLKQQPSVG